MMALALSRNSPGNALENGGSPDTFHSPKARYFGLYELEAARLEANGENGILTDSNTAILSPFRRNRQKALETLRNPRHFYQGQTPKLLP
jgi:hypothetical protein